MINFDAVKWRHQRRSRDRIWIKWRHHLQRHLSGFSYGKNSDWFKCSPDFKKVSNSRIGSFPSVAKPVVPQAVHRCGGGGPHDKYFRGVGAETEPRSFGVESRSVSTRFYYLLLGWEKALYVDKFNKMKCIWF